MAEFPALPLWTDAYLGDTSHLTTMQHGAYLLLLIVAWRSKDTRLPDDDRLLARYARCTPGQWKKLRPDLEAFFTVANGFWTQGRLIDEAKAVRSKKEAAAANGRASALKRLGRHSAEREQSESGASTKIQLNQNQNHIPLSKDNGVGDPEKVMFDLGKAYLASHGISASKAGSLLGKWKRDYGAAAVIEALGRAQREGAIDPVSFIEGCLRASKGGAAYNPERLTV